jgi:hypothetical protein
MGDRAADCTCEGLETCQTDVKGSRGINSRIWSTGLHRTASGAQRQRPSEWRRPAWPSRWLWEELVLPL